MSKDMRDPMRANVAGVCSDVLTIDFTAESGGITDSSCESELGLMVFGWPLTLLGWESNGGEWRLCFSKGVWIPSWPKNCRLLIRNPCPLTVMTSSSPATWCCWWFQCATPISLVIFSHRSSSRLVECLLLPLAGAGYTSRELMITKTWDPWDWDDPPGEIY